MLLLLLSSKGKGYVCQIAQFLHLPSPPLNFFIKIYNTNSWHFRHNWTNSGTYIFFKKQPYVPPHHRRNLPETRFNWEHDKRSPLFTTVDIHQLYIDFQATSYGDQKLNLPKFNGDIFMDWLVQVEVVFFLQAFPGP